VRYREAGTSLTEVLVTTGVAGLTAILAFGIYARGSAAYRMQARSVALEQRLRAAVEVIARDLRQAGYLGSDGAPVEVDDGVLLVRSAEPRPPDPDEPGRAIDAEGHACSFQGDPTTACPALDWAEGRVRVVRLVTHRYRLTGDVLQTSSDGEAWSPLAAGVAEFRVTIEGTLVHLVVSGRDDDLERTVTSAARLRNLPP